MLRIESPKWGAAAVKVPNSTFKVRCPARGEEAHTVRGYPHRLMPSGAHLQGGGAALRASFQKEIELMMRCDGCDRIVKL